MKKRYPFSSALQVTIAAVALVAVSVFAEAPDFVWLRSNPKAPPLWISERSVVSPEGTFRWELFSEISQGILTSYLENQERERNRNSTSSRSEAPALLHSPDREVSCQAFFSRRTPHYLASKAYDSLEDLAENALLIVTGRVSSITQGFHAGLPASLVAIETPRFLKRPGEFLAPATVYISFPHAAISAGGHSFCTHDSSFPDRPKSGDQLLMFAYDLPENPNPLILEPFAAGLILERISKEIEISDKLGGDLLLSSLRQMTEVEAQLGEILSRGEGE